MVKIRQVDAECRHEICLGDTGPAEDSMQRRKESLNLHDGTSLRILHHAEMDECGFIFEVVDRVEFLKLLLAPRVAGAEFDGIATARAGRAPYQGAAIAGHAPCQFRHDLFGLVA